jgi:phosphogluconate dehydratase
VLAARPVTGAAPSTAQWAGTGRELFGAFRAAVGAADHGASVFAAPIATVAQEDAGVRQQDVIAEQEEDQWVA